MAVVVDRKEAALPIVMGSTVAVVVADFVVVFC